MEPASWEKVGNFKEGVFWRHQKWPKVQFVRVQGEELAEFFPEDLKTRVLDGIFFERGSFQLLTKKDSASLKDTLDAKKQRLKGLEYYNNDGDGPFVVPWDKRGLAHAVTYAWADIYVQAIERQKETKVTSNLLLSRADDPPYKLWFKRTTELIKQDEFLKCVKEVQEKVHSQLFIGDGAPQDSNNYVLLSENPLGLFETWIHEDHHRDYLTALPDVEYPTLEKIADGQLKTLLPLLGIGIFDTYKGATPNYNEKLKKLASLTAEYTSNSTLHPQRETVMVNLSTEVMLASGVDRLIDQNTLMGNFSAREVGNLLGLTEKVPMEWMHMVAFSYGGLTANFPPDETMQPGLDLGEDDKKGDMQIEEEANDCRKKDTDAVNGLRQTPQQPLNLCLGTSECNTHMLRWETAWKKLFQEEAHLSQETGPIKGELVICNNTNLEVPKPRHEHQIEFETMPFGEYADGALLEIWETLSFLVFTMQYQMTMKGQSLIFDTDDFTRTAQFYPFQRQLTTRAEVKMDDLVFSMIKRTMAPSSAKKQKR